ncbi:MAG TPA: rRNA pseudouridine synthase [Spirochaetes bacterium]|nr:rRNA pseudouridine synthase [Spirochaetota bacterium]
MARKFLKSRMWLVHIREMKRSKIVVLVRLQKLISHYGYSSRRRAEKLIIAGKVRVNGIVANELGIKVPGLSIIEIDGNIINRDIPVLYLMLYKPAGYICTKKDPGNRKDIYTLIKEEYNNFGIFSVGRLDYSSEGLLLITNDGHFSNNISHPSNEIMKKYEVTTDKDIPYKSIAAWENGIYIKGIKYTIRDYDKFTSRRVVLSLYEGKNREIRRLFEELNIKIVQLKRIAIGALELGDLSVGKYRELSEDEVRMFL